jgi:Flp pilus assembly protein TadD
LKFKIGDIIMSSTGTNAENNAGEAAKSDQEYNNLLNTGKAKVRHLFENLSTALIWDNSTRDILFAPANKKEDYWGAIDDFRQATNVDPKKAEAYFLLGVVCAKVREDTLALEYLNAAVDLGTKDAEAYLVRAAVKNILSDFKGAQKDLNLAARLGNPAAKEFAEKIQANLL